MKHLRCGLGSLLATATWMIAAGCTDGQDDGNGTPDNQVPDIEELVLLFEYDTDAPLDIVENSVVDVNGVLVYDISFRSPGNTVPSYLVVPPGEGLFAGLVFMHKSRAGREQFRGEAIQLAGDGFLSILLEIPETNPATDFYIMLVKAFRRAFDLLLARSDVDPGRLGYVGHSYGATWGYVLAGVEERVKTYILMAGLPQPSRYYPEVSREVDGVYYLGHAAPASLFFQFATEDEYISESQANMAFNAASEPKQMSWYEATHDFNAQARADRAGWLVQELGTKER